MKFITEIIKIHAGRPQLLAEATAEVKSTLTFKLTRFLQLALIDAEFCMGLSDGTSNFRSEIH